MKTEIMINHQIPRLFDAQNRMEHPLADIGTDVA